MYLIYTLPMPSARRLLLSLGFVSLLAACTQQVAAPVVQGPNRAAVTSEQPARSAASRTASAPAEVVGRLGGLPPTTPDVEVQTLEAIPRNALQTPPADSQLAALQPAAGPALASAQVSTEPNQILHTVTAQDTLFRLARRYDTTTDAIVQANNLANIGAIAPGQTLRIPQGTAPRGTLLSEIQAVLAEPAPPASAVTTAPQPAPQQAAVEPMNALEPAAGRSPTPTIPALPEPSAELPTQSHVVQPGETIYRIARTYHSSVLDIMTLNNLEQPEALQAGRTIRVPMKTPVTATSAPGNTLADQPAESAPTIAEPQTVDTPAAAEAQAEPLVMGKNLDDKVDPAVLAREKGRIDRAAARRGEKIWPVQGGRIVRRFGDGDNGVSHTGVNIAVPMNTPVLAMADGEVLYADNGLRNYGNMVLLRHAGGLVSAYAHSSHLLVKRGERVRKGQVIALAGATGNVTEPQVHFEIRRRATAVNPQTILGAPQLVGQ